MGLSSLVRGIFLQAKARLRALGSGRGVFRPQWRVRA